MKRQRRASPCLDDCNFRLYKSTPKVGHDILTAFCVRLKNKMKTINLTAGIQCTLSILGELKVPMTRNFTPNVYDCIVKIT